MRTLIRKEWRETLKLALPAFLIFTLVLAQTYRNCATQPLLSVAALRQAEFLCAVFGLALGWFQIHSERHRDLWAFLIHRPLTPTEIFLAKVAAGLSFYGLAAGLPLLGLAAASAAPGKFASPFEWAMAIPLITAFLLGVAWYFAGMLTGLRTVRWQGSRGLPLVAALLVSILALTEPAWLPGFAQRFVVLVIASALLAAAAWGAFAGGGGARSQPVWGRRALTVTLALGVILIGLIAQVLLEALWLHGPRAESAYHEITRDGLIVQVIEQAGQPARIVDLTGAPVNEPGTGRPLSLGEFDQLVASHSFPINVDFGDQSQVRNLLEPAARFYSFIKTADRISWYWTRDGSVAGFDTATRRPVGKILPGASAGPDARFLRPQGIAGTTPAADSSTPEAPAPLMLATPAAVCRVNLAERASRVVFSTTPGDEIGAARSVGQSVIVVTRHFIRMITPDGKPVWKVPLESTPGPRWVKVSRLAAAEQYAIWTGPYQPANRQNRVEARRYSRVLLASPESGALKDIPLTPTGSASRQGLEAWSWRFEALLTPPVPVFYKLLGWRTIPRDLTAASLAAAIAAALAGEWLGRRYALPAGTRMKWAVFHLLAGLPGFVAFVCVQEWPAREACPRCRKQRVVERAHCEHCAAEFAPAAANGTEIFEALEA